MGQASDIVFFNHFAQEPQKMRLPDKLQRILTFPEQPQCDDKPYQFSSVVQFHEASHKNMGQASADITLLGTILANFLTLC